MLAQRVLSVCLATLIQTSVFNGGFFVPTVSAIVVVVNEFNNCPHLDDSQVIFENVTLRMDPETKKLYISSILDVKQQLDNDITLKIVLKKCTNGAEEHTCTEFFSANQMNPCKKLPEMLAGIAEHTQGFPTSCPVPVGKYPVDNAPLDVSVIEDVEVVYGFWRLEISGVVPNGKTIFCTFAAVEIKKPKKKKKVLLD